MFDGMNKKAAAASGEDHISDLPDALLHHVLSLLPLNQAARTSVLARRWRHLWKGMPALHLVGPKTRFATAQEMDRFFNRLIAVRGHLPLVSFEVEPHAYLTWDDYPGHPVEPERSLCFDSWIKYALACKVQDLKVVGDVIGCQLKLIVPLVSQHLRCLDVHHVYMRKDYVDFSSCSVLEELKMKECVLCWMRSVSFPPSLKRLFLIKCIFPYFRMDPRLSISAPGIVSLRLIECAGKTPLLGSMPQLDTAFIDLSCRYGFKDKCEGCTDGSCEGCHGYPVGSYRSVLLNVLSNAINLELKDQPEVYIYKRDLECCPIFGRLKTLLLDMWCRHVDMHALVRFLQHTPILEKLTLQLCSDKNLLCAGRGEREHVGIEQSFSCAHLKEVSIECEEKLMVKDKVRQIVKILTRNGILKDQITFKKLPRPKVCRLVAVSPSASDDNWSGDE